MSLNFIKVFKEQNSNIEKVLYFKNWNKKMVELKIIVENYALHTH